MDRSTNDLDAITIQSPCTIPWDSMKGNERKRFCGQCRLHVHDISQLTPREAVDLLEKTGGDCCLRVWRRPDGRVVTKDCGRVRLAIERRLLLIRAAAAAVFAAVGLAGCRSQRLVGSPGTSDAAAPAGSFTMGTPSDPTPPRPDGAVPTMGK